MVAVTRVLLVLATALQCLVVQDVQSLNLWWISPREGSIAGGTTVTVHGADFATDQYTGQNLVFLDDVPCIVEGYTVSPTTLTCITQPYPWAFEGVTSHRHRARILSKGVSRVSTSFYARFRYNWNYTPQVRDVLPSSGPVDSLIEVGGYRFRTGTDFAKYYKYIYLGNQICDFWNNDTNSASVYGGRWHNGLYYIKCRIVEQIPGAWNASAVLTTWSGQTWNHSLAMKLDHNGQLSMFELYPDINAVQSQSGGDIGGTLLRITGTGFGIDREDMEVTVDVDGSSCEVIEHNPTEILCWTTQPSSSNDDDVEQGYRYLGSRGVSFQYFPGFSTAKVNDLYNLEKFPDYPDKVAVFPSFSTETYFTSFNYYGARYMAFFTPVQSGKHTFFIKSDDSSVLYIQKGHNISSLTEIARATGYVGWSSSTGDYSSTRSAPMELEKGEKYLLVGDMADGGGGDFLRVGVLMHETNFLNNETSQSVRERQVIEFESHGHYDIQAIHIELDATLVNDSFPPEFELQWGNQSTTITLQQLISNEDIIVESVYNLLKGICTFIPQYGVYYYNDQAYDFETDTSNYDKESSFCGLQSVSVISQTIIIDPGQDNGFLSSNLPYLCMAYKIPVDVQVDVIIHIDGFGWRSISLTSGTQSHPYTILADWSDGENANDIIPDNTWRFGCTNIQSLLTYIDSDELQYTINGLGYQLLDGSQNDVFNVDVVSFTSDILAIHTHLPPSKPNGLSIDQLISTTKWELTNNDTILDIQVEFEIVPTTCDHQIPLISLTTPNDNDMSILQYDIIRQQNASESIEGTYQLGIDGVWTDPIDYFSDSIDIRDALNGLPYISGSVSTWYRSNTLPQDKLGQYCPGRDLVVRFETKPGDQPILLMNSSNLTGHGLEVTIKEIETGGLYLYPIPGHMLQTVEKTPQVHVRINNQLAACNGGLSPYEYSTTYTDPCGFTYNETLTPVVNSISTNEATSGDVITINGADFSLIASDNFILFGEIECIVITTTTTTITCSLGKGQAGIKQLWLHVLTGSVAQTNGITLEYKVTLSSFNPTTSGTQGGIELTIMGDGFVSANDDIVKSDSIGYTYSGHKSVLNNGCSSWKNTVLVGDKECVISSFSGALLRCVIPAGMGSVDVTVTVYCEDIESTESYDTIFNNQFVYESTLDSTITAINPMIGSSKGGQTVVIIGTGFSTSIEDIIVMIGDSICNVLSVNEDGTSIECLTTAHQPSSIAVSVTTASVGSALGTVMYEYIFEITDISKCAGSLLGGQLMVITGNGFGSSSDGMEIAINAVPCSIKAINDTSISCMTGSTAYTHKITNNAHNAEYGLGYAWDKPIINITVGDSIEWKWTGTAFTPLKRIIEVDSSIANEYNDYGFISEKAVTGTFVQAFSSPGEYYYIMEGYGAIGFRGIINVQPHSNVINTLSLTFNSIIEASYSPDICDQSLTEGNAPSYSYLVDETPLILSVSPTTTKQGSVIEITVNGIIDLPEYNILTIGGKPFISAYTSSVSTEPVTELPEGTYSYIDTITTITCTVPDVYPGDYRLMLHVTGRGWAYGEINNTIVSIKPSIHNDYVSVSGSQGGGALLTIPVTGLNHYMIGQANVFIGNTPCAVQDIEDVSSNPLKSDIICKTLTPIDDGYSSLISGKALSYWSLQFDLYNSSNVKYSTESTGLFTGSGKLSNPANIIGTVVQGQTGIGGQLYHDQSAYFSSSYLKINNFEQYHTLSSFSFELWFKSPAMSSTDKYTVLASSYQSNDDSAKGFIVTINSCNQIEYWLSTGNDVNTYNDSILESDICTNCANCNQGMIIQTTESKYQFQLPVGVWNVLRSTATIVTNDWNHLVFGFDTTTENSDHQTSTEGVQKLFINNDTTEADVSYLHTNMSDIYIGGDNILHTKTVSVNSDESQLYPFNGYIDEISLFDYMLSEQEVKAHYHYGTTDEQPIWINTEYIDSIGTGMVPNTVVPLFETTIDEVIISIDLDNVVVHSYSTANRKGIQVQWAELHGLYQVPFASYQDCLQVDIEKVWSSAQFDGSLIIYLETGKKYYFIDPVGDNCITGTKFEVDVGDITVIDWKIGDHQDITINQDGGVFFKWNDAIPHNVIEMSSAESVTELCTFVDNNADNLGMVVKEWHSIPSASGEVIVNDLSIGKHYFVCSVGTHCKLGMRFTVNVESNQETIIEKVSNEHIVPWYIPTTPYQTLSILEGEDVTFGWNAFHSLHQVTKEVYESCDTSVEPLYEWGRPSVDNSVTISALVPGSYYFICSVSGHCDAGMKLQVDVFERELTPLVNPIAADCNTDSNLCSYSYSESATPILLSVEPSWFTSGDLITLKLTNYEFDSDDIGEELYGTTVLIGNHPCKDVTLANITSEIECIAPNQEAGTYQVQVHIDNVGYARPTGSITLNTDVSYAFTVTTSATATNLTPTTGSMEGGTHVTITGTGFSHLTDRMNVDIGGHACSVMKSTRTSIVCVTSPIQSLPASLPVTISINDVNIVSALTFAYSQESTPVVSLISKTIDLIVGDVISITGEHFNPSNVTVQILNTEESFYWNNPPSHVISMVSVVTETSIECTVPNRAAGTYSVFVYAKGKGLSQETTIGSSSVTYKLGIDQVSPMDSGHGGGLVLTITGSGFPAESGENVEIKVCESTCHVTTVVSEGTLLCQLDPSVVTNVSTAMDCNVIVTLNDLTATVNGFTFSPLLTPLVTSVSPDSGGTAGGTHLTIKGEGFLPIGVDAADLTQDDLIVTIDNAICEWYNQSSFPLPTDTVIKCRTSEHRTTIFANINVFVKGKGDAIVNDGLTYQYVDRWSSKYTWGGQEPPLEGESVYIKQGQTVFFDTNTPVLNLILIEGSLIFEDEQDVHLQAKYIFINNGKLQIGTEENPFLHKATITLHGDITDPEIPIYGAKVIGIRQGELDIHGKKRNVTWTRLSNTAMKNTSQLELQEAVDWVAGDNIVIAPTGKEGNETETRVISSVSDDGLTVFLEDSLSYTHHGITDTYENGASIDIRAEVGLLSHNVIIEGALEKDKIFDGTGADQYGMQIMIHRTGPHPTPIRIENAEVRHAGQAFRLGRYAIHFHLSGNMSSSYIKNCAIHHSNNRALTAHGVHNLLIEGNVAYDIKGHAFFIEDGIETNNRYIRNFGIYIRSSSSLLNTDQIPAVFWITNPNNVFIDNAAVASRAYGFWYDLDNFPSGPSYTSSVCPNKEIFGQFSNNVAHSCNEFGLRIWEKYTPFADGCSGTETSVASLYNFTTYANDIHGVEFSVVGNVKMIGFKVADNRDNGIEIQETIGDWEEATIEDSLIISHTSVNNGEPGTGGIKTPNTRGLKVSNVTFVNFNFPQTSCLRACSHCKAFQGGFQVSFEKLTFLGMSYLHKTSFQWEHEVLFHDLDGSLSGEVGGWVLPDSGLHPPQYCTKSVPEFSVNEAVPGTVCTSDVYILRMAWNSVVPLVTFQGISVNVSNEFGYSIVPWRHYRLTHMDGYMLTLPSTYAHSFIWDLPIEHDIDTNSYSAGLYSLRPNDYIIITHNFVQLPDHVNIGGNHQPVESVVENLDPNRSWFIDNTTDTVSYIISGMNSSLTMLDRAWTYSYEPCPVEGCPLPPDPNSGPLEDNQRRWSDPSSWPSGQLPVEGDDVIISSSWRMLLDISPPPLMYVHINGELQFEDVRDYNFTANTIVVSGPNAHLIVGEEDSPFSHTATITLTGNRDDVPLFISSTVRVGSKSIAIFGNVTMIGQPKTHSWTRLADSTDVGDNVIYINGSPNWSIGDNIVISSSSYEPSEAELRTIVNYDSTTGAITVNEPLQYAHKVHQLLSDNEIEKWINSSNSDGDYWWGEGKEDLILSPEVGVLSRNIIIQGGDDPDEPLEDYHYGCRILIGEYTTSSLYSYTGTASFDSIEVRYCGQGGYFSPTDPRYSIAIKDIANSNSYITRSSIHHGYNTGIGIHASSGVMITDNVIHRTTGSSIICGGSGNAILGNLAMLTSTVQPNSPLDNHAVDFPATFDINRDNIIRDNAAGGSNRVAYRYSGEECDTNRDPVTGDTAQFWNNTAHSGLIALVILGIPADCASVSGLTATHHWDYSVFSSSPSSVSISHMKLAVGKIGLNLNIFGPDPVAHLLGQKSIQIVNTLLVGFLPTTSCASSIPINAIPGVSLANNDPSVGIMMSSFNKKKSKMDGTGKWHLMKGYPTVDGEATATNITFAHFTPPVDCTYTGALISNNPISPDAVHPLELYSVVKLDIPLNNLVHFYDPNPDWIVQEDCVDMDCDGPKHALIRDGDGSFGGTSPVTGSIVPFAELRFSNYSSRIPLTWLDFEGSVTEPESVVDYRGVYRGNPFLLNPNKSCIWMKNWNAYHCHGLEHLMLVIENMDGDSEVRRVSPLALVGGEQYRYTDLLNGPMDHGWCTYYTCLKRLSTFFGIVSTDIDYNIWMTGSLPGSLRLHLLNSNNDQTVRVNIWYKDPRRKDVYKNGVFIEATNTKFLDNGAVTQLDGDYTPSYDNHSGANYFEKEKQILTILVKGSTLIEIRTPPIVQISLNVAVTVEEYFINNLISNLAFTLNIDISRIRVVNIISEDSARKRRSVSDNIVTMEFGDPPLEKVEKASVSTAEEDWTENEGENDNVDMMDPSSSQTSSTVQANSLNEEPPENEEEFAAIYNKQAKKYNSDIQIYQAGLAESDVVNQQADSLIELVQSGGLQNLAVNSVKIIPAVPPAAPSPPVVPPQYSNISNNNGSNVTLVVINNITTDQQGIDQGIGTEQIEFTVPSKLVISMEPSSDSGHLVYVAVSMLDANGNLVRSLGFLNPWVCTAMLITSDDSEGNPKLEGEIQVSFEDGIAVFTRLRVDSPSTNLRLSFVTNPGNFIATSTVLFAVHAPAASTPKKEIVLILIGSTSILSAFDHDYIVNDIRSSLSQTLDVDPSRIQNLKYEIENSQRLQIQFDLLDNVTTDPPNVPSLNDSIAKLQNYMENMNFTVSINGSIFEGLNGSIQVNQPTEGIDDQIIIIITIGIVCSSIIVVMLVVAFCVYCCSERKNKKQKKHNTPSRFDYTEGTADGETEDGFRLLQIPRASVTNRPPIQFHHPHSSDPWIDTTQTSLGSTESMDDEELWSSLAPISNRGLWSSPEEMPRIPRPFAGLPMSTQQRQSRTLAGISNHT